MSGNRNFYRGTINASAFDIVYPVGSVEVELGESGIMCGKGDSPRPRQISQEEYDLRWDFMVGKITDIGYFNRELKRIRSKINGVSRKTVGEDNNDAAD